MPSSLAVKVKEASSDRRHSSEALYESTSLVEKK